MKLLIIGASGKTGRHALKKALDKGYEVTVFVRTPSKIADISHENLRVLTGDANDRSAILKAVSGQEAVISCLGSNSGLKKTTELHNMTKQIVSAMEQQRVLRIIYCASAGIDHEIPGLMGKMTMKLLSNVLEDHRNAVEVIKSSNLDWTIARPMGLTNQGATGSYRKAFEGIPDKGRSIPREDVADFMVQALEDENYIGKSVGLSS
ncbi:MAG: NAD(P)-dependent oxidoreductase [Bacillus sp. (in: firmicutes)]